MPLWIYVTCAATSNIVIITLRTSRIPGLNKRIHGMNVTQRKKHINVCVSYLSCRHRQSGDCPLDVRASARAYRHKTWTLRGFTDREMIILEDLPKYCLDASSPLSTKSPLRNTGFLFQSGTQNNEKKWLKKAAGTVSLKISQENDKRPCHEGESQQWTKWPLNWMRFLCDLWGRYGNLQNRFEFGKL